MRNKDLPILLLVRRSTKLSTGQHLTLCWTLVAYDLNHCQLTVVFSRFRILKNIKSPVINVAACSVRGAWLGLRAAARVGMA